MHEHCNLTLNYAHNKPKNIRTLINIVPSGHKTTGYKQEKAKQRFYQARLCSAFNLVYSLCRLGKCFSGTWQIWLTVETNELVTLSHIISNRYILVKKMFIRIIINYCKQLLIKILKFRQIIVCSLFYMFV